MSVQPLPSFLSTCHWQSSGVVPLAVTVNVAELSALTDALAGWEDTVGATVLSFALMVNLAFALPSP